MALLCSRFPFLSDKVASTRSILQRLFDAVRVKYPLFTPEQQANIMTWEEEVTLSLSLSRSPFLPVRSYLSLALSRCLSLRFSLFLLLLSL